MLLRKPTHAGGSPTPSAARFFTEIDASVSTYHESPNPAPTSPQSKTHAFFSSPFTAAPPSPPLPLRKRLKKKARHQAPSLAHPAKILTADFFSTASSLSPPRPLPPPPQSNRRNFLNLDLKDDARPLMLAGAFASTPTPTEIRDEFISDDPHSKTIVGGQGSAWAEASSEPTPKPPSQVYNPARATLMTLLKQNPLHPVSPH
ncbi:hypothetical protein D9757_010992 [Collybiopsis confluens]|uniref:Uncharacterized protein n=1 Tax=Collybiopsis confluens TaxID=2823264 RepID=A0A8H5LSA5_9AGAR|nr:hypothetical protein D9757_010992 [Collybiopsis confluens]